MKSSVFLLFMVFTLCSSWPIAIGPSVVPMKCCFSFIDFPIPHSKIVNVYRTSSSCPGKGIVVLTRRTEFCVKPDEEWIKPVMEKQLQE